MPISLEAMRVNAKLSRNQVCDVLGIHYNTLKSYEKYRTKPNLEMAKKIAALYGCELDDIKWSE